MSTSVLHQAGHPVDHHNSHDNHNDDAKTIVGFWIYLMSDCIIFAILFATFGVLANATAMGPAGKSFFELPFVLKETMLLLISSFTFGVAMLNMQAGNKTRVQIWLSITFFLGAGFIAMELYEFAHLVHSGATPSTSAYWSAFFTLVGTHGLHVSFGMLWIVIMIHQIGQFGLDHVVVRRLSCLSLFWHFLDLIWICVFTFVYLREFA